MIDHTNINCRKWLHLPGYILLDDSEHMIQAEPIRFSQWCVASIIHAVEKVGNSGATIRSVKGIDKTRQERMIEIWSTIPEKFQDERPSGSRENKTHKWMIAVSLGGFLVNDLVSLPKKKKKNLFLFRPSWSLILANERIVIKILRMVKSQAIEPPIS